MFYIDLDELEPLNRSLRLFGKNSFAPYSYQDGDHYQNAQQSTRQSIEAYLKTKLENTPVGQIHLLTHLRTWGHVFNPVSFYFISDHQGHPLCTIAEVGNTFNEQKMFLLPSNQKGSSYENITKEFYVSPFSDLDTIFHFRIRSPKTQLRLSINQSQNGETYFRSTLSGTQKKLSDWNLLKYSLRFPLITLTILTAIHWQAFLLFLKGIRARPKAEKPHLQKNTRPYLSHKHHPIH